MTPREEFVEAMIIIGEQFVGPNPIAKCAAIEAAKAFAIMAHSCEACYDMGGAVLEECKPALAKETADLLKECYLE